MQVTAINKVDSINYIMVEDINITDHIIEKENSDWEEKWNTYEIRKFPDISIEPLVNKSTEPWYRRFENKKRKHKR